MEEKKQTFARALSLLLDEKATQAEPILRKMADDGDVEAKFTLAGLYLSGENDIVKNEKECIRLLKDAAENDNYEPAAGMLSAIYYEGLGTKQNYAESAFYARKVTDDESNDTEPWKGIIYTILGEMRMTGNGITKNIPQAWHLLKFAIGLGTEDAALTMQRLQEKYPMTENGEIDLNRKGRSKLLTFTLFAVMFISALQAFLMRNESETTITYIAGTFAVVCLLNLLWVPYSAYAILAFFAGGVITGIVTLIKVCQGDLSGIVDSQITAGASMYGFFAFVILLLMQKRKKGYAHPWNILTRRSYDGRGLIERLLSGIMQYGEGGNYKTESSQTKIANTLRCVISALLLAFTGYGAWTLANSTFDFNIEWNCFNSPNLYGTLSFIGFFLQFFDWQHFSFDWEYRWKDRNGNRRREKSMDVLDVVEGRILFPLLMHFLVVPMIYGALLYYVIMGGFAILQGLMPWLLALLIIASNYPSFRSMDKLLHRKYRFALIPITGFLLFLVYSIVISGLISFAS